MKERPIIFSAPMVRALLAGTKTQTRRVIKGQPTNSLWVLYHCPDGRWNWVLDKTGMGSGDPFRCPYGAVGDRLWVRETCCAHEIADAEYDGVHLPEPGTDGVKYAADSAFRKIQNTPEAADGWWWLFSYRGGNGATVPPIHMPRWASRITLEITGVRIERLQSISEADAAAEGVEFGGITDPATGEIDRDAAEAYEQLWESLHGRGSWDANPWVWVIEFKRVDAEAVTAIGG